MGAGRDGGIGALAAALAGVAVALAERAHELGERGLARVGRCAVSCRPSSRA